MRRRSGRSPAAWSLYCRRPARAARPSCASASSERHVDSTHGARSSATGCSPSWSRRSCRRRRRSSSSCCSRASPASPAGRSRSRSSSGAASATSATGCWPLATASSAVDVPPRQRQRIAPACALVVSSLARRLATWRAGVADPAPRFDPDAVDSLQSSDSAIIRVCPSGDPRTLGRHPRSATKRPNIDPLCTRADRDARGVRAVPTRSSSSTMAAPTTRFAVLGGAPGGATRACGSSGSAATSGRRPRSRPGSRTRAAASS